MWLCELAPVRDGALVDDAVAAVFSLTARAGQSTREALVELLRGKQLLLVLDNCEHLVEAAAALAETLQRSCERLVILATSREGLGIEGERLVPVAPLGVPGAGADLDGITGAEAVRLFAERAAAVKPGFQVTAQNAAAVAAVVRRLDGIALAVELAAARVPAMTVAELARRLERSFAVLAVGRRGAAARHQTLRATIDWSFQLLSGPEQALLARLAVFAGGCTLQAAEAVCGGDGIDPDAVFELLASLVARSLVVAEESGPGTRYRLLETIRQYGEQRLNAAGETGRWRARHAGYYAGLPPAGPRPRPRSPARRYSGRCGSAPSRTTCSRPGHGRSAPATWTPRLRSWPGSRPPSSGPLTCSCCPAKRPSGCPARLSTRATRSPSRSAPCSPPIRGDVTGAGELCRRAADASARQDPPDWRVEETISAARANSAMTTGAFADTARFAEQAARIARAGGDLADASNELSFAAGGHVLAGDGPAAVPLADEALALARQVGAPALVATGLLAVGAAVAGTDPEQARACLRESRELSTALGYHSAIDLSWAAGIAFLIGDQAATLELGRHAIDRLRWGGDRLRMGIVLPMIAGTLAATRPDAAAIIGAPPKPTGGRVAGSSADQPDRDGGTGRRARAGTARPRRGHGLGPSSRLHPHPDHPSPQRARVRDPAMNELEGAAARAIGHYAGRADIARGAIADELLSVT